MELMQARILRTAGWEVFQAEHDGSWHARKTYGPDACDVAIGPLHEIWEQFDSRFRFKHYPTT